MSLYFYFPLAPLYTYLSQISIQNHACLQQLSPLSLLTEAAAGAIGSCWCQSNSASREQWAGLHCAVCHNRCTQPSLGASCRCAIIGIVAHWEEEPRVPAGDPGRGGSRLLCAIPLHRTGKYTMFIILNMKISFIITFNCLHWFCFYLRFFFKVHQHSNTPRSVGSRRSFWKLISERQ